MTPSSGSPDTVHCIGALALARHPPGSAEPGPLPAEVARQRHSPAAMPMEAGPLWENSAALERDPQGAGIAACDCRCLATSAGSGPGSALPGVCSSSGSAPDAAPPPLNLCLHGSGAIFSSLSYEACAVSSRFYVPFF